MEPRVNYFLFCPCRVKEVPNTQAPLLGGDKGPNRTNFDDLLRVLGLEVRADCRVTLCLLLFCVGSG